MADEKNIVDFGEWIVPSSWNDITLKKFQAIQDYYEGISGDTKFDIRQVLHILCDKTIDEVNQLPSEFLDMILEKLVFLLESPKNEEPTNEIEIDGEKYKVNIMNKLKVGEYVSFDTILKNDPHDYAAMLAVLCRKEGEVYDSKFEAEVYEDRVKLFEKQPITKILPIIQFFFLLYMTSEKHSQLYSQVEEAINHIQRQLKTSKKLGVCKKLYMTWQMVRLKKSLQLVGNTSQTSSRTSHTLYKKVKRMMRKNVISKH